MTHKVIDSEFLKRFNPIKLKDFKKGIYRTNKTWPNKEPVKI